MGWTSNTLNQIHQTSYAKVDKNGQDSEVEKKAISSDACVGIYDLKRFTL